MVTETHPKRPAGRPITINALIRTAIQLTPDQAETLATLARVRNTDKAKIVREALDLYFATEGAA